VLIIKKFALKKWAKECGLFYMAAFAICVYFFDAPRKFVAVKKTINNGAARK
jgi:hypothetical protein